MDKNTCPSLEERIAKMWEYLEGLKDNFEPYYITYPAVITEIKVHPCSENDYDVAFVFMSSNGFYRKKFYKICRHIFTDGKARFRNFYLSLMLPDLDYYSEEEYPELLQEIKAETDLNELLGTRTIVIIEDSTHICYVVDGYPCTSPDEEEFDPLDDWDFDSLFGGIISQISTVKVPEEINSYLKKIIDEDSSEELNYPNEEYVHTTDITETDSRFNFKNLSDYFLSDIRISHPNAFGGTSNISYEKLHKCGKYTIHLKDKEAEKIIFTN